MKVAIVHDWLVGGGAERVVYELHQLYPNAPIYTSYCSDEWREKLDGKVVTGFLQYWPFSVSRKFLPLLRILWFTSLNFSDYDLVISSSGNGEAKGVHVPAQATHICYCHSPVHFYWRHYQQYLRRPGFGVFSPLARLGLRVLVGPLRAWDLRAAQRPDFFIANSTHIKADIKTFYGRRATVVHPPVDIARFAHAKSTKRHGFVTAGRQVPLKHTEVIVQACTQLNVPLTVIGRGPEHRKLVNMAGPTVTFLDNLSDAEMPGHIAAAEAFLFASFEDFGITPIEAMATGTPVIAYKAGGAVDYVIEGKTGTFFNEQTVDSLAAAIKAFQPNAFDHKEIRDHAAHYSAIHFKKNLQAFINKHA